MIKSSRVNRTAVQVDVEYEDVVVKGRPLLMSHVIERCVIGIGKYRE